MNSLRIFAFSSLLLYYLLYLVIFFGAYLFGNYKVIVTINTYGEAQIEMAMNLIVLPIIAFFAYDFYKRETHD